MSKEKLQTIFNLFKDPNYIAPVSDYKIGRAMFNNAYEFSLCASDEQRRGWNNACADAMRAAYADGGLSCSDSLAMAVN